jgi:hypothetical protein
MKNRHRQLAVGWAVGLLVATTWADNIDPGDEGSRYAYGENVGWLNFRPGLGPGVTVGTNGLVGYVWAENIGWIDLAPTAAGVSNDGAGHLSGYAWGENVGWINFHPQVLADDTYYGVNIDSQGNFSGWAWGENLGWIHFQSATPVAYRVQVCLVGLADLARFATNWLGSGAGLAADLDHSGTVDLIDFSILATQWLNYCPEAWPL